ncbi:MAG TPA: STAS domain-containing protein [Acidimicrobiales bacterium]|nr:STAS domain-containing protein [Acidimicrobiales bacterium]
MRQVDIDGPTATLVVDGEIDMSTVGPLRNALTDSIAAGCAAIRVDLGEVTFMDSAGLASLVSAYQMLGPNGVLTVVDPGPAVLRVLEIAGLAGVVQIE